MSYDIRNIHNINHLIMYFSKVLNWDIDTDSFEDIDDISYDFSASDLGLKEEAFAKIKSIKQLPPLVDGQKWGIFCIEFDSKRFEVTALRKVLSGLVPSRRNSADHAVWSKDDLLFLCFWGEDNNRTIGIAHFEDKQDGLPQIKMTYCAPAIEDTIHIQDFVLKIGNLTWPIEVYNYQKWHDDWSKAFTTSYKQVIRDSHTLTIQLAKEAISIRDRILETLKIETEAGYVHQLYNKFKETLIHDMSEKDFADMYAQTVVYGLFSARCMDETIENFSAAKAVDCIPNTNPFLKSLMKECLGAQEDSKLSFDELEIGNVVELLEHTKTDDIIHDFNRQTGRGKEDTVIHFYEMFLEEYDKTQKVERGVYYTPQPVVNFIVKAVDEIIKTEFNLCDGLASTEQKRIKIRRQSKKTNESFKQVDDFAVVPAIQILDPSTGTGTFIRQTILQIYENFKISNSNLNNAELNEAWNDYVTKHLLSRINAFELMMAPYAVAHMKLALVLKDTGYKFNSKERLNVFLTNSLEKPGNSDKQVALWDDPLAKESLEANIVKKNNGINVIIGNPPYNVSSINKNEWINNLIKVYKDGLTEKKLNLDDDYIKFLRLAQTIADASDKAIVGFITNNSYIDGITHRQIRKSLMKSFSYIYILDLHGNVMKHEKSPNGDRDENVFDITQGVAICLLIKNKEHKHETKVYHYELLGLRNNKYDFLNEKGVGDIEWRELSPDENMALFVPFNNEKQSEYESGIKVDKLFKVYNSGIQTKCDEISVQFDVDSVQNIERLFKENSVDVIKREYPHKKDGRDWTFDLARKDILNNEAIITPYYYRPFDVRYIRYSGHTKGLIAYPRREVMTNIVGRENMGLCLMKQFFQDTTYNHVMFTTFPIDERTLYSNRGGTYFFPLYLYCDEFDRSKREYNFDLTEINRIEEILEMKLSDTKGEGVFTGEDIIAYVYAVLYSNAYRNKFNDYLKYNFPIVPLPKNKQYFVELSSFGYELMELHNPINFCKNGDDEIVINCLEKFEFDLERMAVILNGSYELAVNWSGVYNFEMGGYKPIQKWLKDRKHSSLSKSDISILTRIIECLQRTKLLMEKIDKLFL